MNIIEGEVLTSEISGSFGGGGAHTPIEESDTLRSIQKVNLLFAVSEGEITSIDDILLNKVTLSNYTATFDYRTGTLSQSVIPGFIDTETPLSIVPVIIANATSATTPVTNIAGTFVWTINGNVDAVRLTFTLQALKQYLPNGDLVGYYVSFNIYTKNSPSSVLRLYSTTNKTGKASNPYSWDVIVKRPETTILTDSWQVSVERTTPDDTGNSKLSSITSISAITQIYYKQLTYPGTALVAITLTDPSQFSGQVPTVLIKGKGKKVQVPNNYDPVTLTYTGIWDLGMNPVKQFTSNLAWVIYDILHDQGCLGIDSSDIDRVSFYNLSQYSDNLISDGLGGTIPRYSVGNQYFARENVPTFLQGLLSLCNAVLTTNEFGQIQVVYDHPGLQPSRLVTNANVVSGIFNYTSNDLENRYSLANVTYNNYNSYSETNTATWQDDSLITRYGLQPIDIILPGCIYEAQAIRKARWAVYTNAISNKVITFNVGFEGLGYKIGSVIKVMDSDNSNVIQHGLIKSSSLTSGITTLVIDRTLTLLILQNYTISFYGTDGLTIYNKSLIETNGSFSSISYAGSEVPLIGSNFMLSGTITPSLYKVVGIKKNDIDYTITGLIQDEAKYAYVDNAITISTPTKDFINISDFNSSSVTNLLAIPNSFSDGVNKNVQLHVTWDWNLDKTATYKANYEANWRKDNSDLVYVSSIEGQSFDINALVPGTYSINVWAINPISGIKSAVTNITYNYRTTAGTSTLFPPINARVTNTSGLVYNTPSLSLSFDYNTANDGVSDSLLDYIIELWDMSGTTKYGTFKTSFDINKNGLFTISFLENVTIFGSATRKYQIKLFSRDLSGFVSISYNVIVDNVVPTALSATIFTSINSVSIKITTPPEMDVTGYKVWSKADSDWTAISDLGVSELYDGQDSYITLYVPDNKTYYYKIAAYDSFGKTGLALSSSYTGTGLTKDSNLWSTQYLNFSLSGFTDLGLGTLGLTANVTASGNNFTKVSGGLSWLDSVFGSSILTGNCVAIGVLPALLTMFGLSSSVNANNAARPGVDYGIYKTTSNTIKTYVMGVTSTATYNVDLDGIFSVEYSGTTISFKCNGVEFTNINVASGLAFVYDTALYQIGSSVSNAQFGQITSNANTLYWTGGKVLRGDTSLNFKIQAGSATWSTGILYAYFDTDTSKTSLLTSTNLKDSLGINKYPLATYSGGGVSNIKGGDGSAFISGSQLLAATIGTSQLIAGSVTASILDATNAVITGTAQIATGVVTDILKSSAYDPLTKTGWKLDKAGNMISYGALTIESSGIGNSRMVNNGDSIKVYDASGVLRVKLGNLT